MDINISKVRTDDTITIKVEGRIDSITAPELGKFVKAEIEDAENLVYDFGELEYISSAGIRVIVSSIKMLGNDNVLVINADDSVREVFEMVGMDGFLAEE